MVAVIHFDAETAAVGSIAERVPRTVRPKRKALADKKAEKAAKTSQLRKLRNESESFFLDFLSDANGVDFHRFQIVAWTVVLGIIFVPVPFARRSHRSTAGTACLAAHDRERACRGDLS
jgi:hypothetical protein